MQLKVDLVSSRSLVQYFCFESLGFVASVHHFRGSGFQVGIFFDYLLLLLRFAVCVSLWGKAIAAEVSEVCG